MLRHKRVLAAAFEDTPGTAETLLATDAKFNAFNVTIQQEVDYISRDGRAQFGRFIGSTGTKGGVVTFSHRHIPGSGGTHPAWATTFLPACGWKNTSGVFTPTTEQPGSNVKTLTIGVYEDGLLKSLRGAMGMFTVTFVAGQPILWNFTFRGVWVDATTATILAPTYPTEKPLRAYNAGLLLGATNPIWQTLSFDSGNLIYVREDGNSSDNSGLAYAVVTDRVVTGTINPESDLTELRQAQFTNHQETALTLNVNTGGSGVGLTIDAPKVQFTAAVEADRNGIQTDELPFECHASSAPDYDDELKFTFDST